MGATFRLRKRNRENDARGVPGRTEGILTGIGISELVIIAACIGGLVVVAVGVVILVVVGRKQQ
jgi:hypothetical protein